MVQQAGAIKNGLLSMLKASVAEQTFQDLE